MTHFPQVEALIKEGKSRQDVITFIRDTFSVKKSRAYEIYAKVSKRVGNPPSSAIVSNDKYTYNDQTDKYIINLKCAKEPLVISGNRHRAICRDYSSWGGDLTAQEICVNYSLTPEVFSEYRRIFSLTKEREPLSIEEIAANSVEHSAEAILEQKRYAIYQDFEKKDWKETQADANKWRSFKAGTLDVAKNVLDEWVPSRCSKTQSPKSSGGKHTFIVGANDWHIGELFEASQGFAGKDFNSEIATELINQYADKIEAAVKARAYKWKGCFVSLHGDILNSAWNGQTVKGTQLHNDRINETMFALVLDTTAKFLERMVALFPDVTVAVVQGNHDGPMLSILGLALQAYFRKTPTVSIRISSKWAEVFRVDNVALLVTHGGHPTLKASLPNAGAKLKSYLQDMWSARSDSLVGCVSKCVISGHFHRFWQQDMGDFDFYCFGGLPPGDGYADALNLRSKPRQNALISDGDRIVETLHFYMN